MGWFDKKDKEDDSLSARLGRSFQARKEQQNPPPEDGSDESDRKIKEIKEKRYQMLRDRMRSGQ